MAIAGAAVRAPPTTVAVGIAVEVAAAVATIEGGARRSVRGGAPGGRAVERRSATTLLRSFQGTCRGSTGLTSPRVPEGGNGEPVVIETPSHRSR